MKKFLSVEKFKEIKVLLILELLMGLLLVMLISINKFDVDYFNWKPFVISIGIWILSSIIDKERHFNLATLLGTCTITYIIFWLMFNILF